jgi:hypothetical protein
MKTIQHRAAVGSEFSNIFKGLKVVHDGLVVADDDHMKGHCVACLDGLWQVEQDLQTLITQVAALREDVRQ